MLSFGWSEIALVAVVIIIFIGPKEIPNFLRQINFFSKSLKKASRQFKNTLNDLADDSDLNDVKQSINTISDIKKNFDPTKELKKEINSIKESLNLTDEEIKDIKAKVIKDKND